MVVDDFEVNLVESFLKKQIFQDSYVFFSSSDLQIQQSVSLNQ